jgi:hypothetical protein
MFRTLKTNLLHTIVFMNYAMCGLFLPLEKYVGASVLTMGILYFVVLLG